MPLPIEDGGDYPLKLRQGRSKAWRVVLFETPNPPGAWSIDTLAKRIPLTGYAGAAEIRTHAGGDLLATIAVVVNQAAVGQAGCGEIDCSLSSVATDALDRGGEWELVLTQAGEERTVLAGNVDVELKVTAV